MLDTTRRQGGLHVGPLSTSSEGPHHYWGTFPSPSNRGTGMIKEARCYREHCFRVRVHIAVRATSVSGREGGNLKNGGDAT